MVYLPRYKLDARSPYFCFLFFLLGSALMFLMNPACLERPLVVSSFCSLPESNCSGLVVDLTKQRDALLGALVASHSAAIQGNQGIAQGDEGPRRLSTPTQSVQPMPLPPDVLPSMPSSPPTAPCAAEPSRTSRTGVEYPPTVPVFSDFPCFPPGLGLQPFRAFAHLRSAKTSNSSLILSIALHKGKGLSEQDLCHSPVEGVFDPISGLPITSHGLPPFQKAKLVVYFWMHYLWAMQHSYRVIFSCTADVFPASFVRSNSLHLQIVQTAESPENGAAVFNLRYSLVLHAMQLHPSAWVIHDDVDSETSSAPLFGSQIYTPHHYFSGFLEAERSVCFQSVHHLCPCSDLEPQLWMQTSGSDLHPSKRVSNDYFQAQLDQCFGRGVHDVQQFSLWFSGQIAGRSDHVEKVLRLTKEYIFSRTLPQAADNYICDMASLTLAARDHLLGSPGVCNRDIPLSTFSQGLVPSPIGVSHGNVYSYVFMLYPHLFGLELWTKNITLLDPVIRKNCGQESFDRLLGGGLRPLLALHVNNSALLQLLKWYGSNG